jgi:hypothetical protein
VRVGHRRRAAEHRSVYPAPAFEIDGYPSVFYSSLTSTRPTWLLERSPRWSCNTVQSLSRSFREWLSPLITSPMQTTRRCF